VSFTDGGRDIGIPPILLRRGAAVLNARIVLGRLNMAGGGAGAVTTGFGSRRGWWAWRAREICTMAKLSSIL